LIKNKAIAADMPNKDEALSSKSNTIKKKKKDTNCAKTVLGVS
jgi:hypothetical protein